MRFLLSQIDQVSAGEVVYPSGGRLGPRWQRDVELVLVHDGHARIAVDGEARAILRAGSVGLLLPGHREQFAFAGDVETRHSWVQARVADPPVERLSALPAALPASTALTELVREAVTVARTPLSTAEPLLAALAAAAFWRYAGEAESHVGGPGETVERVLVSRSIPVATRRCHRYAIGVTPSSARKRRTRCGGVTCAARATCSSSTPGSARCSWRKRRAPACRSATSPRGPASSPSTTSRAA
jgi:hypothetical protein